MINPNYGFNPGLNAYGSGFPMQSMGGANCACCQMGGGMPNPQQMQMQLMAMMQQLMQMMMQMSGGGGFPGGFAGGMPGGIPGMGGMPGGFPGQGGGPGGFPGGGVPQGGFPGGGGFPGNGGPSGAGGPGGGRFPSNQGPGPGNPASTGTVMRGGKPIGAQIAGNFDNMVSAAARDGVQLRVTSGKRSYQEQVALYNKYGPGRAARPGTSNHESGNAIDFTNTPGAFRWLKQNAGRFGFYNKIPSEPWHYSTTGR